MRKSPAFARRQSTDVPLPLRSRVVPQRCPLPYGGGKGMKKN